MPILSKQEIFMKQFIFASTLTIILSFGSLLSGEAPQEQSKASGKGVIIHTVMFSLHTGPESEEAKKFLADGHQILTSIPGVENFEVRRQISKKNDFQFGFSMHFADTSAFENYLKHPLHEKFVSERWEKEVTSFLEADYILYESE